MAHNQRTATDCRSGIRCGPTPMIEIKTAQAWQGVADCQACAIRAMVLFADLNEEDFRSIHQPIDDLLIAAGARLYPEGGPAGSLFTVRTGTVKLVRLLADGQERIVRLLRAGQVAGLEALTTGVYDSEAVALEDTQVCRIPGAVVRSLSQRSPRLHGQLMQQWHGAVREADAWLADINSGPASRRVRQLILRMRLPGDPAVVRLFSREDMGAMTGLTLETVSRELSALARTGLIEPLDRQGRSYRICDPDALALR